MTKPKSCFSFNIHIHSILLIFFSFYFSILAILKQYPHTGTKKNKKLEQRKSYAREILSRKHYLIQKP